MPPEDRVALTTIDFDVNGTEGYNPRFTFSNTRPEMVALIEQVFGKYADRLDEIFNQETPQDAKTVKSVEFRLHVSGKPPVSKRWSNPAIPVVFSAEEALVEAQIELLRQAKELA